MGVAPFPLAGFAFAGAGFAAVSFLAVCVFCAGVAEAALVVVFAVGFDTAVVVFFTVGGFAATLVIVFLLEDVAFDTDMGITSQLKKLSLKYSTYFHDNNIKCFVEMKASMARAMLEITKAGVRER